jgi:hypothetical protein
MADGTVSKEDEKRIKREGFNAAIEVIQELGKESRGQPLTPGFMVFKLKKRLDELEADHGNG